MVMPSVPTITNSLPLTNGRLPSPPATYPTGDTVPSDSDSALSEVDPIHVAISPPSAPEETPSSEGEDVREDDIPESSEEDDNVASEDGEYDLESPLPVETNGARVDRSSSHDSLRPSKRKAGPEDDDYIMNNPELYGLRRSVSQDQCVASVEGASCTEQRRTQGRARPTRQIVSHPLPPLMSKQPLTPSSRLRVAMMRTTGLRRTS